MSRAPDDPELPAEVPEDLRSFLVDSPGAGLMIRGAPGTGKTTLALQLLIAMRPHMGGYYLSPRVGESMLLTHFPWLKEKAAGGEALTADAGENGVTYERSKAAEAKEAARTLERSEMRALEQSAAGEEALDLPPVPSDGSMESALFPELDLAYRIVEQNLPQRTAVVVDSLDALALRYRINESRLYTALSRDLVEGAGVALICILESAERGIEYLGDGVVELSMDVVDGERVRTMETKKLRGRPVRRPFQPFSLIGGKVRTFGSSAGPPCPPEGMEKFVRRLDEVRGGSEYQRPARFSDFVYGGGVGPGGVVAMELESRVPMWFREYAELMAVASAGAWAKPALIVGTRHRTEKETAELYRHFGHLFGATSGRPPLRIGKVVDRSGRVPEEMAFSLAGRELESDLSWSAVRVAFKEHSGPAGSGSWEGGLRGAAKDETIEPGVVFFDMDSVAFQYGADQVEARAPAAVQDLASHGVLCFLVWREGFPARRSLVSVAGRFLKASMLHGTLALQGLHPQTPVMLLAPKPDPAEGPVLWPVF